MIKRSTGLPLFILGIFLILFFSRVFQEGVFFDGLIYACLANNLADGIGSFWFPLYSEMSPTVFYEHPTLAYGLESIFMEIFDGSLYTEKIYSFVMAVLMALFIGLIWRKLFQGKSLQQLYWLPIFLWIITPKIQWSYNNNMLENTMGMFTIASVYFLLVSINKIGWQKFLLIFLSAILLLLSFLSKGFPGLFPLGLFFLYWIFFNQNYSLNYFLKDFLLLFGLTFLVFFLLFYFNANSWKSITSYLDIQFIESVAGRSRVGSRLNIMKNLFNELIPFLILILIFFLSYRKRMLTLVKNQKQENKYALFFLTLGLCGSVPLMISPKLSSFYLVVALPYFAISVAFFLSNTVNELVENLRSSKIGTAITKSFAVISIVVAISLTIINYGTVGRDNDLISDLEKISTVVDDHSLISVHADYYQDWTVMSYFQRYHQISFDVSGNLQSYHLVAKGSPVPENYEILQLNLVQFDLLVSVN